MLDPLLGKVQQDPSKADAKYIKIRSMSNERSIRLSRSRTKSGPVNGEMAYHNDLELRSNPTSLDSFPLIPTYPSFDFSDYAVIFGVMMASPGD